MVGKKGGSRGGGCKMARGGGIPPLTSPQPYASALRKMTNIYDDKYYHHKLRKVKTNDKNHVSFRRTTDRCSRFVRFRF